MCENENININSGAINNYGQQSLKQYQTKDFYIQKSKNQNTAGWILLVSGTVMTVGGLIAFDKSWDKPSYTATDIYGFITLAGVVADLISIPLFISAGVNKRKAASLSIKFQNYPPDYKITSCSNSAASITLHIRF